MVSIFDILVCTQIPGVGSTRLRTLLSHFDSPDHLYQAPVKEIASLNGFSKKLASEVSSFTKGSLRRDAEQYATKQLSRLNKAEGSILSYWDKDYPELLKRIDDPPVVLFMKGALEDSDRYAVAIVGTRSPSSYGIMMAERFSEELSRLGITVVSGLARGIDTAAHTSAVKTGGRTIAVIGSGIDVIYPPENKKIVEQLVHRGAMLSEFPMGAKPDAVNFPRRNRIISGLSLGTLVIETDVNGGAMITAAMALDQNREVFAVPGAIDSKRSKGCHVLIKNGQAKLVESADDIVAELASKLKPLLQKENKLPARPPVELTLFEQTIYHVLSEEPVHIDVITEKANVATSEALVQLLNLEFKGLVRQLPGKMFVKV